ncbi:hypothetical protein DY000_02024423 [Brassica cretica]|uniref:Uncharacterized protein n=1 Tax=Brassica cretica TaxID=69181 RepID=A0ABQ7EFN0_BRACR|nr:hypothetical protein DY000_02024423 [Brassica cretica]
MDKVGLALLRFFCLVFDSSSSSLFFFGSPSTSEAIYAKNNPNPSDDQKQAFVVVGRAITGIEAELKVEKLQSLISSLISEVREMLLQLLVDLSRSVEIEMCCCYAADEVTSFREICYLCTVVTGVVFLVLMSVEIEMCCCYVADEVTSFRKM